jgi:hypothetical protein
MKVDPRIRNAVASFLGPRGWAALTALRRRLRRSLVLARNSNLGRALGERLGLRRRAFERAYRTGAWTSTGESLSGNGSSLEATERLRRALPGALEQLRVSTLLDVPCGDWHWLSTVELPIDRYIGGDLLPDLVENNRRRFGDERHTFLVIDLCRDGLPAADLLLCRDALIHFSDADIWQALKGIAAAEISFVALTTFPATSTNEDIRTGIGWRYLNLEVPPFELPPPLLTLPEGYNRPDQVLGVWRVESLRSLSGVRQ